MKSLTIINAALVNIFAQPEQTVRIFLVPIAIPSIVFFLLITLFPETLNPLIGEAMLFLLVAFSALWAAINFHRKALLAERFGWLPRLHLKEMLAYGLMCIAFSIVLLIVWLGFFVIFETYIVRAVVVRTIATSGGEITLQMLEPLAPIFIILYLARLLLGIFIGALALRIFALLPAVAIDQPMLKVFRSLTDGWLTLFLIVAMLTGVILIESLILSFTPLPPAVTIPYEIIRSIFGLIFCVSLLTAVYGQFTGANRILQPVVPTA